MLIRDIIHEGDELNPDEVPYKFLQAELFSPTEYDFYLHPNLTNKDAVGWTRIYLCPVLDVEVSLDKVYTTVKIGLLGRIRGRPDDHVVACRGLSTTIFTKGQQAHLCVRKKN